MTKAKTAWLDADEAVEALGVSRATLYAYVSRGRIRSEAAPGAQRRSRYSRDDIERLKARSSERRNPEKAAEHALHWGLPILESAITLIADEHIYYRGHELGALVRERSVAEVAALLWTGTADAHALDTPPRASTTPRARESTPFIAAAQSALALASADDPQIGRASCRERVYHAEGAGAVK